MQLEVAKVSKSIFLVSIVVYEQCYDDDNSQEYDLSMESLPLRCNKPFHFCSKDTHVTFILINF